ncbi:MAG: hypothetical protein E5Y63_25945 [Mesorhizobium sp.]|uniref:RNA-directed DNA polymerase n=1 Tax=Mesorhizobium sp. TaxID=1871066 RepID=UPI0012250D9F|nr:RNA-directed DNA polymerase [Mesorhizobium sp.]TIM27074.1 MAG: hypothetical protein E5Y63_25945 [Mesorhizobium sp.]
MRSPRFDLRAKPLQSIFSPSNLERVWKTKIRVAMRQQLLNDGVENFDFHVSHKLECRKLSQLILSGSYVPQRAQRILVEKSKGLCRQLVIPTVRDALVLQCLSDALYKQIRGKAPTTRSFFEPKEHRFASTRSGYGTFASWLNFQRELFKFSKNRAYVVVTDIANYYDTISYAHLRNVISGITDVEECVLDMLIYVLSDLLWQPDYTPRVEVGLPQINLDAPRLLAHCFLYELDAYLDSNPNRDFVRYMDDIDIGVDTIVDAKHALKSVDLVLQTKQVRLNSGKTAILTRFEALRHFRVIENARLDTLEERVDKRLKAGLPVSRERKLIEVRISRGLRDKVFDTGNGMKVLKRWITLAGRVNAQISPQHLEQLIRLRPDVRENVLTYIRSKQLSSARAKILASCAISGLLVDDAAMVDIANYLTETMVKQRHGRSAHFATIISAQDADTYYGLYCRLWLQSKYDTLEALLLTIQRHRDTWIAHERLGRLVGSFRPLFSLSSFADDYISLVFGSHNSGARETYKFQGQLSGELPVFDAMFPALSNANPSRGTGITHAKFLCLVSALQNPKAPTLRKDALRSGHHRAFEDIYYRTIARASGAL